MLWLDAPSTVGFSQCASGCGFNDEKTASETLAAMKAFYAKFPELKPNDLYVAGNVYGGRQVPKLAKAIHVYNLDAEEKIALKGAMVGNGLTDYTYDGA